MLNLRTQIRIVLALAALSLLSGGFAHLALEDIANGEPDVSAEWNVVRLCAVTLLTFIGAATWTLRRALKAIG